MILHYELLTQEDINVGVDLTTKRNPAGGSLAATQVGIHTLALGQQAITAFWAIPVVAGLGVTTTTVTVPGAAIGDFVLASYMATLGGLILMPPEVTSPNTVTITVFNPLATAITLDSPAIPAKLRILVLKSK